MILPDSGQLIRTVSPYEVSMRKPEGIACKAKGCVSTTRGGTNFCSNHIQLEPYVQAVKSNIDKYYSEVDHIKRGEFEDVEFHTEDLLSLIAQHGAISTDLAAKNLQLSHGIAKRFFRHLAKSGIVYFSKTRKGKIMIMAA